VGVTVAEKAAALSLPTALAALLLLAPPLLAGPPCATCHASEARQWRRSLHARSMEDPLYLAMRGWARADLGGQAPKMCSNCHSVALAGGAGRTPSVNCVSCHRGAGVSPGPAGWRVEPGPQVAASRPTASSPHPVVVNPRLASGELCLVCHGELHNPRGVPICTTGQEAGPPGSRPGCTTCHMPFASHVFPGSSARLLSQAASLAIELNGRQAVVTVVNLGTGHALPTGSILRRVRLEVFFQDKTGQELGRRSETFARTLEDAGGHAPVPPWRAAAVHSDTRLQRGERRVFRYPIPAGARRITARLVYSRAPAKLLERLGLANAPDLQPAEMTRTTRGL